MFLRMAELAVERSSEIPRSRLKNGVPHRRRSTRCACSSPRRGAPARCCTRTSRASPPISR